MYLCITWFCDKSGNIEWTKLNENLIFIEVTFVTTGKFLSSDMPPFPMSICYKELVREIGKYLRNIYSKSMRDCFDKKKD